jgi:hypothetical protein
MCSTSVLLSHYVAECDRCGISDRSAAACANALLTDFGIITDTDQSAVINRYKIRSQRERFRSSCQRQDNRLNRTAITALYFDGRRDKTQVIEKIGDKW